MDLTRCVSRLTSRRKVHSLLWPDSIPPLASPCPLLLVSHLRICKKKLGSGHHEPPLMHAWIWQIRIQLFFIIATYSKYWKRIKPYQKQKKKKERKCIRILDRSRNKPNKMDLFFKMVCPRRLSLDFKFLTKRVKRKGNSRIEN